MADPDRHDVAACARAWQTLRLAHDRVARRLDAALARECGLAVIEFDALLYLRSRAPDGMRLGALQQAVPLSQSAVSRLVTRLHERGLIARTETALDARVVVVRLTDAGTALVDRAVVVHARTVRETLTGHLSDAEQAALLRTLSRIG